MQTRERLGLGTHFRFLATFSRLTPSLARRFAVRFSAAALDAFFARAFRSSGVMFFAASLPPCFPNLRAISVMAARTAAGICMLIPQLYT